MGTTAQKLREEGKYLGFSKELGYVYLLNEKKYALSKNGITNITHLKVAL